MVMTSSGFTSFTCLSFFFKFRTINTAFSAFVNVCQVWWYLASSILPFPINFSCSERLWKSITCNFTLNTNVKISCLKEFKGIIEMHNMKDSRTYAGTILRSFHSFPNLNILHIFLIIFQVKLLFCMRLWDSDGWWSTRRDSTDLS